MNKYESIMFVEDIASMSDEEQRKMYEYCKLHANRQIVRDNLNALRAIVTSKHFKFDWDPYYEAEA